VGLKKIKKRVGRLLAPYVAAVPILERYPNWDIGSGLDGGSNFWSELRRKVWWYLPSPSLVKWFDDLQIYVYPGDVTGRVIFLTGRYEPNEFCLLRSLLSPGMTFLDVGANLGLYSLFAAKRVGEKGRVVAIEPSTREFQRLTMNLGANGLSTKVRALRVGVSNVRAEADLFIATSENPGHNSLGGLAYGTPLQGKERVQLEPLDDIVRREGLTRVDFMKIDIEGAELFALRGAADTLVRFRPTILLELNERTLRAQGCGPADVWEFLIERGYLLYGFDRTTGLPIRAEKEDGAESRNLLAIHEDNSEACSAVMSPWQSAGSAAQAIGDWTRPYETLRKKWVEVPVSAVGRMKTTDLLKLADDVLLDEWQKARLDVTTGPEWAHRGWYHTLYAEGMRGKKVMDVGSGFGVDSITFAQHGAKLTFVDLVETNLNVLERLCRIMGLNDAHFHVLHDVDSLRSLDTDYDVIMAMGSLHHAPAEVMRPECQELVGHLRVGGRWLQLAYPESRWIRDGRPPFSKWGEMTDGVGTPWCEWYDVPKLLSMFGPAKFDVVLYQEFHNHDFNWFDLVYRGR